MHIQLCSLGIYSQKNEKSFTPNFKSSVDSVVLDVKLCYLQHNSMYKMK